MKRPSQTEPSVEAKAAILDHFKEWSGGFKPEETDNDERCNYVEFARQDEYAGEPITETDLYTFLVLV